MILTMILSKCNNKKQEASQILGNLGLKTQLNKIPLLGDILF